MSADKHERLKVTIPAKHPPAEHTEQERLRPNYIGGYADVAEVYAERGWLSVLPLPPGQKWPPPEGFTGKAAQLPTAAHIAQWRCERPDGNPALYLVDGLICVDIDNYAKKKRPAGRALEVVAEVEGRAGVRFPATWVLRNRTDGSEKRFYRVPTGLTWRSNLGAGVDLVHAGHRYVNAGVNPDTGNPEQWYASEGELSPVPPRPSDLAQLPDALVLELMRDANGLEIPGLADPAAARRLLKELPKGVMDVGVRDLMSRALADLSGLNGSRHDATLNHVRDLVKYGASGLAGTRTAIKALRSDFVEAVWDSAERGSRDIAVSEFDRMETNGAQLAAAVPAEELALLGVALNAMAPGGMWHEDTLWPAVGEDDDDALPSWAPVDIGKARRGVGAAPPTVLARSDGECLFYPGKTHSVHGESESGKSWLVQCATAEQLIAGNPVLYIDFEDEGGPVAQRLILLGVPPEVVDDPTMFVYVHPEEAPSTDAERAAFDALLGRSYTLAVIDGVTDSMGVFGLSTKDNDDVARWQRALPKAIARQTGAAVVCVDHVTKDTDNRGRFALGGQHKMAGLSGAAYLVEMEQPFAAGQAGRASVRVGKDRPGLVRGLGGRWRKTDRTQHVADLYLDSTDPEHTGWSLDAPSNAGKSTETDESRSKPGKKAFRPTWFMEQVSRYLEETDNPAERTSNKIVAAMCEERKAQGKTAHRQRWRDAIKVLVEEGFAKTEAGARESQIHVVVKPYRQIEDPLSDNYSEPAAAGVEGWKRKLSDLSDGEET
ncbi:bifunctional DNA primase/polymerase [Mycobacterium attenuatum]|uniref:bifunctional DNA primase/polymerase n=1 Tax=Mycobacterium attenuatum TaxID=2341086 RepID=UPI000F2316EF|nr:AAA family ATPase [Mycobacterium attenuatum]VBA47125.1 hypothetical protein LAUMK41_00487 [Mycobacterium attenuatum]